MLKRSNCVLLNKTFNTTIIHSASANKVLLIVTNICTLRYEHCPSTLNGILKVFFYQQPVVLFYVCIFTYLYLYCCKVNCTIGSNSTELSLLINNNLHEVT